MSKTPCPEYCTRLPAGAWRANCGAVIGSSTNMQQYAKTMPDNSLGNFFESPLRYNAQSRQYAGMAQKDLSVVVWR